MIQINQSWSGPGDF